MGDMYQKLGRSDKALSFKQFLKNDSFNCYSVASFVLPATASDWITDTWFQKPGLTRHYSCLLYFTENFPVKCVNLHIPEVILSLESLTFPLQVKHLKSS